MTSIVGPNQSERLCNYCHSNKVVSDEKFGVVCTNCSMVLEENVIVSQTEFSKQANGTSALNGQFVGEFCTTPFSSWNGTANSTYMRNSRDHALVNGRKRIQWLASQLGLDTHYVDAAHRLFVLAIQRNFIQGRKTLNVIAACLYIVCRRERAPRLLLDFSEVLQTNVYELGSVYLKFRRLLNIRVPVIDPTHYIERFASKLSFGSKELEVSRSARTLVARMKKDWIQTGRRPAGICGAALIVAARMHGFRRTRKEVVEVMRICEQTLKSRLMEFEATPSSNLTMEEFLEIDLPTEENPPAYSRLHGKSSEVRSLRSDNHLTDKQQDDISSLEASKNDESRVEMDLVYKELDAELHSALKHFEQVTSQPIKDKRRKRVSQISPLDSDKQSGTLLRAKKFTEESCLSDVDDEEAEEFLLTEAETKRKSDLWHSANAMYLKEKAEKESQEIADGKSKSRRKRRKKSNDATAAHTAADATKNMLSQSKKISKKINYDKLNELFGVDMDDLRSV